MLRAPPDASQWIHNKHTPEKKRRNKDDGQVAQDIKTGINVVENRLVDALPPRHHALPVGVDGRALEYEGECKGSLGNGDEGGKTAEVELGRVGCREDAREEEEDGDLYEAHGPGVRDLRSEAALVAMLELWGRERGVEAEGRAYFFHGYPVLGEDIPDVACHSVLDGCGPLVWLERASK